MHRQNPYLAKLFCRLKDSNLRSHFLDSNGSRQTANASTYNSDTKSATLIHQVSVGDAMVWHAWLLTIVSLGQSRLEVPSFQIQNKKELVGKVRILSLQDQLLTVRSKPNYFHIPLLLYLQLFSACGSGSVIGLQSMCADSRVEATGRVLRVAVGELGSKYPSPMST